MPDVIDSTTPAPAITDVPPAATAAPVSQSAPVVQSSREMAQAASTDTTDWKAKYDGLVGTYRSRTNALQTEIDAQKLLVGEQLDKVTKLEGQIRTMTEQLTAASALQGQVTTLTTEKQAALDRAERLELLTKYPALLSAPVQADD